MEFISNFISAYSNALITNFIFAIPLNLLIMRNRDT